MTELTVLTWLTENYGDGDPYYFVFRGNVYLGEAQFLSELEDLLNELHVTQ